MPRLKADIDFELRLAGLDDINFILDSWCANQADAVQFRQVDSAVLKVELRARIRRLMTPLARFVVCAPTVQYCQTQRLKTYGREIFGYIAYSWDQKTMAPVIHFVYVKHEVRRRGLAHEMLHLAGGIRDEEHFWSTHTSAIGKQLLKVYGGTWNPFMLEFLNDLSDSGRT